MKFQEFLQEENGNFSSSRLVMYIIVIAGIVDWIHAVFTTADGVWRPEESTIMLILGAMGLKVGQKFAERKKLNQSNSNQSNPTE